MTILRTAQSYAGAAVELPEVSHALMVPNACVYSTHDFRRGEAQDLQVSGAPLAKILAAGRWCSAGFMTHLARCDLKDVALEAAILSKEEQWLM